MSLLSVLDDLLDRTVIGGYDRVGFHLRRQLWDPADLDVSLKGKTAVVTGANSGLGLVTARELVRRGARVYMVCRNEERGSTARDGILRDTADAPEQGEAVVSVADMGRLEDVRAFADRFAAENSGLDLLINNAGALLNERGETEAGIESTFAANVLGYFLLTELMLPRLIDAGKQGPAARVINVSSGGMYPVRLNVDDPQWKERPYDGVRAYAESKRAEVFLTELWARRLSQENVFMAAMHPGWADTPGVQTSLPTFRTITQGILRSPEEGADTIVWLAVRANLEADFESGKFWCDRRPRPVHRMKSTRSAPADLKRYHDLLRELTGVGPELEEAYFNGLEAATI